MRKPHTNTFITDGLFGEPQLFGYKCFTCGKQDESFEDFGAADQAALKHNCSADAARAYAAEQDTGP